MSLPANVRNALPPEVAALIRARIAGKEVPRAIAKPKRAEPVKCYVSQFYKFDPRTETHTLQLPIAFRSEEYNAKRTPWYLREKWVKEKREMVWLAMAAWLPSFKVERLRSMEFVRIGLRKMDSKDNLRAAFKPIVDATCSYARWGEDAAAHVNIIGTADDWIEKRGIEWTYRQMQCESNPRLYGIRIVMHCAPSTPE